MILTRLLSCRNRNNLPISKEPSILLPMHLSVLIANPRIKSPTSFSCLLTTGAEFYGEDSHQCIHDHIQVNIPVTISIVQIWKTESPHIQAPTCRIAVSPRMDWFIHPVAELNATHSSSNERIDSGNVVTDNDYSPWPIVDTKRLIINI